MIKIVSLLVVVSTWYSVFAQNAGNTGIIYGKNHAFSLTAPNGWILDNSAGVNQGIYAVFYRVGESWQNGEAVMYANTALLDEGRYSTLDELIQYDLDDFKKNYKGLSITDGADVIINEKVIAKVKYLSGKSYGNFEAIAYIDAGKTGVMLVLSARSKKGFKKALNSFEELVKSYVFLTEHIETQNVGE